MFTGSTWVVGLGALVGFVIWDIGETFGQLLILALS